MVPHVLIVHSDLAVAARLKQLIVSGNEATVDFASSSEEGLSALRDCSHLDLCVLEMAYPHEDVSVLVDAVRQKFPRARLIVISDNTQESDAESDTGPIVLYLPREESRFISLCVETLSSLEGCQLTHFRLGRRVRSDRWSDWYEAHDLVLKRDVYIAIIHAWASEEESIRFRTIAALRAQAMHDHVQSVYLGGEYEGRHFVSHEKWEMPSLAQLLAGGQKIDARMAARILHAVGTTLLFWDAHQYPHAPLNAHHVSLSPQGVVKVENMVDPTLPFKRAEIGDLVVVAHAVRALLDPGELVPSRMRELLNKLRAPEQVVLETSVGEVTVGLQRIHAPRTVANFLSYVDRNAYDGSIFHNVILGFVVQGGNYYRDMTKIAVDAPVRSESDNGLLNVRGTLAMARNADPDSATSQFVFNLVDNRSLNRSQLDVGYTVFGKVVRGMGVIDKIAEARVGKRGKYEYFPVDSMFVNKVRRKDAISVAEVVEEAQALDTQLATVTPEVPRQYGGQLSVAWSKAMTSTDKAFASMSKAFLKISTALLKGAPPKEKEEQSEKR